MRSPRRRSGALALLVLALPIAISVASAEPASVPPPTPVPPDASPSPFVTSLRTPEPSTARPDLRSPTALLADLDSGQILYQKAANQRRPIASVTKIMTALLVLERSGLRDVVSVGDDAVFPENLAGVSALGLEAGEELTVEDLLYALLLQSANDAAVALADHVAGTQERFVRRMNQRARRLGMTDTRFRSPNGLDDRGYSTARDLLTLTRTAYAASPALARISSTRFHDVPAPEGRPRTLQNRNVLLWLYPGAFGVKTGYTARAGFCFVGTAERDGRRLVTIVLGATGEPFSDAAVLLNYGFEGFTRDRFVETGEDAGTIAVPGGVVRVVTGGELSALVPTRTLDEVSRSISVDLGAAYPPAEGERVATMRVAIPGLTLGEVPLVATDIPPPPPVEDDGPWWARAAGSVAGALGDAVRAIVT